MTISIWRYSHLALAVSSFLLLTLASVTGILLSFEPVSEKLQPYRVDNFNQVTLAQTLPVLRKIYPGISELTVDANQFVQIKGSDAQGKKLSAYVDPVTGKILGTPKPQSEFFEWVTALHRSLFIHETGRFFIGVTAFLLLLITISGSMLTIQRQRGLKRFFSRIVKDNFAQYYHVVLGRLSLIPIFILALTGTHLSLDRFGFLDSPKPSAEIDFDAIRDKPVKDVADFDIFKTVMLTDVKTVEFPFSEDVEDYYTLKLADREVTVNQVNGDILGEVKYPNTVLLTNLSLDLHTGRTSAVWAIILAIASGNILFFIYSGFAMTFKRRANRMKNKFTAENSEFIILVGSENGNTFRFANAILGQLVAGGKAAYITEINSFRDFPKATHIIVMTATYGLGNPPTNAINFEAIIEKHKQRQPIRFCVVGFGSHGYPDFCKFAFEVDNILAKQSWAVPMLEIHTINDRSPEEFNQWATTWSQLADIPLAVSTELLTPKQGRPHKLTVVDKTTVSEEGGAFLIRFSVEQPLEFTSGDLLAIYPAHDHRERLYSIGKIGNDVQLSVKLHTQGLGSEYLYRLQPGETFNARIDRNPHFYFPKTSSNVMMICNGTGIAPFLGMIDQLAPDTKCHLYCGFRGESSYALYNAAIQQNIDDRKLSSLNIAYSREGQKQYVKDLLEMDTALVADALANNGVIMLCGSLAMQNNVIAFLEDICQTRLGKSVSYYQSHSQVLMDCY